LLVVLLILDVHISNRDYKTFSAEVDEMATDGDLYIFPLYVACCCLPNVDVVVQCTNVSSINTMYIA